MIQIPVYVFTGFLDSGKTKFIQETLEDPRFNAGERTLLLVFEEGEEEYDFSTYPHQNVYLEVLNQQTVTTKELAALAKKYNKKVIAFAGCVTENAIACNQCGIDAYFSITPGAMPLEYAMDTEVAYSNLKNTATQVLRLIYRG